MRRAAGRARPMAGCVCCAGAGQRGAHPAKPAASTATATSLFSSPGLRLTDAHTVAPRGEDPSLRSAAGASNPPRASPRNSDTGSAGRSHAAPRSGSGRTRHSFERSTHGVDAVGVAQSVARPPPPGAGPVCTASAPSTGGRQQVIGATGRRGTRPRSATRKSRASAAGAPPRRARSSCRGAGRCAARSHAGPRSCTPCSLRRPPRGSSAATGSPVWRCGRA